MESEKKLGVDELKQVAEQLSQQNKYLIAEIERRGKVIEDFKSQEMDRVINFLFKVIENREAFPREFIDKCTNDLMGLLNREDEENEQ